MVLRWTRLRRWIGWLSHRLETAGCWLLDGGWRRLMVGRWNANQVVERGGLDQTARGGTPRSRRRLTDKTA